MRKKHAIIYLAFSLLVAAGLPGVCQASVTTGGLWATYSDALNWSSPTNGVFEAKEVRVEEINFSNFDDHLHSVLGTNTNALFIWKGFFHADIGGDYDLHFDFINGGTFENGFRVNEFYIDDDQIVNSTTFTDVVLDDYPLTAGWHQLYIKARVRTAADSKAQLFWTPPGGSKETIPADHLGYYHWSKTTIKIPASGKEKFDFATAGAGIKDETSAEINMDIPAPAGDWMTDDVWLFWSRKTTDPDDIVITNLNTGVTINDTGTILDEVYERFTNPYRELYLNVPAAVLGDGGTGRLQLRFEKPASAADPKFKNGIAIVVPYRDASRPEGSLIMKVADISVYHSIGPTLVFPVDGSKYTELDPVMMFDDGETKRVIEESPARHRPNYLYYQTGSGTPPAPETVLRNAGGSLLVPELNPIDKTDPDTFYPTYGREGSQFDVLSSRYVPNLWANTQAQYISQTEGLIDKIHLNATDSWVALQYTGCNFPQDGVNGSGESGGMIMAGLYSTEEARYDLVVAVNGDGTVTGDVGAISCPGSCTDNYADSDVVILTATPSATANFLGWDGECLPAGNNPTCMLLMDKDTSVVANFDNPLPVDGICGEACHHNSCFEPASGFCAPPSYLDLTYGVNGINTTPGGWDWICKGVNSGNDTSCEAARSCGWVER